MSEENVEIARRILEGNRPDSGAIEELLRFAHPNCEYTSIVAGVEPKVYRGHDDLRRYAVIWPRPLTIGGTRSRRSST